MTVFCMMVFKEGVNASKIDKCKVELYHDIGVLLANTSISRVPPYMYMK
jgi:hypothetical protein